MKIIKKPKNRQKTLLGPQKGPQDPFEVMEDIPSILRGQGSIPGQILKWQNREKVGFRVFEGSEKKVVTLPTNKINILIKKRSQNMKNDDFCRFGPLFGPKYTFKTFYHTDS